MLSVKTRSVVDVFIILWLFCAFVGWASSKSSEKSDSESNSEKTENAVKNVQFKWLDKTTLKFTWDPPSSASKSTRYSVKCDLEGKTKTVSTSDTSCTFKDLELCGSYKCTFDASDKSSKVKFTTVHEEVKSAIEAPARPESFRFDEGSLTVYWLNSKKNHHCRTGVKLQIFADDNCIEEITLPKNVNKYKLREKNLLQKTSAIIVTVQTLGFGNLTSALVYKTVAGKTTGIPGKNTFCFNNNHAFSASTRNTDVRMLHNYHDNQCCH